MFDVDTIVILVVDPCVSSVVVIIVVVVVIPVCGEKYSPELARL
jgi:hypothetical protein